MTMVMATVAVWTNDRGAPERLIWQGRRFRSSDIPTLLESDYDFAAMHPPAVGRGWRFQGTDEEGRSIVFDVRYMPTRDEWLLLRTYE